MYMYINVCRCLANKYFKLVTLHKLHSCGKEATVVFTCATLHVCVCVLCVCVCCVCVCVCVCCVWWCPLAPFFQIPQQGVV